MADQAKPVTFISKKYKELRVVLDPVMRKEVAGAVVTSGLRHIFPDDLPRAVEFKNGEFTTSDKLTIQALKEHVNYGVQFISTDQEGEPELKDEAVQELNAKEELTQAARSKCPECGKDFKTDFGLQGHMKTHNK